MCLGNARVAWQVERARRRTASAGCQRRTTELPGRTARECRRTRSDWTWTSSARAHPVVPPRLDETAPYIPSAVVQTLASGMAAPTQGRLTGTSARREGSQGDQSTSHCWPNMPPQSSRRRGGVPQPLFQPLGSRQGRAHTRPSHQEPRRPSSHLSCSSVAHSSLRRRDPSQAISNAISRRLPPSFLLPRMDGKRGTAGEYSVAPRQRRGRPHPTRLRCLQPWRRASAHHRRGSSRWRSRELHARSVPARRRRPPPTSPRPGEQVARSDLRRAPRAHTGGRWRGPATEPVRRWGGERP